MNRRTLIRNVGQALLGTAAVSTAAIPTSAIAQTLLSQKSTGDKQSQGGNTLILSETPFQFSVMLWTVFRDLPFDQRLEKVASAGYKNVELVGEYEKWTAGDFARNNAKRKELGLHFDCTAGLKHGLCNPQDRPALLAELQATLPIMEKLDCPAIILLSGNVVPGLSPQAHRQSCIDGLKAASALIEGKKINGQPVRLLLETIDPEENPKYYLTSMTTNFEIIRSVNHPQVRALYDLFHEQIAEGNLLEKLEKNIDLVDLIHIADVPGRHEPGTGEINYTNIFRKLAELKYDRMVAMEFLPTGDPVTQLRAARVRAMQAAQNSVAPNSQGR
jgi:hydroxypyruvate isomerase